MDSRTPERVFPGAGLGRLRGDVVIIKRGEYEIYIPVLSSIIVSVVLSLVF